MNKVHPSLQSHSFLLPQLEYRIPKRPRRPLAQRPIALSFRRREHTPIEERRQLNPVHVRHRPHRAHHAAEPVILYGRDQVQHFVGSLPIRQFRSMTRREERKLADRLLASGAHDIQQSEPIPVVQAKRCIKWLSRFQISVACKMNQVVLLETFDDCRSRRIL